MFHKIHEIAHETWCFMRKIALLGNCFREFHEIYKISHFLWGLRNREFCNNRCESQIALTFITRTVFGLACLQPLMTAIRMVVNNFRLLKRRLLMELFWNSFDCLDQVEGLGLPRRWPTLITYYNNWIPKERLVERMLCLGRQKKNSPWVV